MGLIARGGQLLLGSDGKLTTNDDCCCDGPQPCCLTRRITSITFEGIEGPCFEGTNGTYPVIEASCEARDVVNEFIDLPGTLCSGGACDDDGSCGSGFYYLVARQISYFLSDEIGNPYVIVTVTWRFRKFTQVGANCIETAPDGGGSFGFALAYTLEDCEGGLMVSPGIGGIVGGCIPEITSAGTCYVTMDDI